MKKYSQICTITDIATVAKKILNDCQDVEVILLKGTLGAGKTTLAIELLRQSGVVDEMQSPTYTYLQAYENSIGKKFYHFDLYRLKNKESFLFAGFDDFLYQTNALVIIEWPEIIESLFDKNICYIDLEYMDEISRKINWYYK